MHKLFLLAALVCSVTAHTQNLTGLYKGTLFNDSTKLTQNYELSLKDDGKNITGTSYTTFILDDKYYFGLRTLKGSKKDGKLVLEEVTLLENNFPSAPPKGIRRMAVIPLNGDGEIELLNGMWQTNRTRQFAPVTGLINLQKDNDSLKSGLMAYLKEKHPVYFQNDGAVVKIEPKPVVQEKVKEEISTVTAKPKEDVVIKKDVASVKTEQKAVVKEPVKEATEKPKEGKSVAAITKPADQFDENGDLIIQKTTVPKSKEQAALAVKEKPVNGKDVSVASANERNTEVKNNAVATENKEVKIKQDENGVVKTKIEPANAGITEVKVKKDKKKKETDPKSQPEAKPYTARETKVMQTVVVSADSLVISLYDNGVVDGDVVSVYVNGVNIIQSLRLTGSAYRKTIVAPKENNLLEIKLVAENLGTLPPNTGLMIIQDKDEKYHVNFSADMDTNASIIVRKE
jgi:hypothetical protein